jgi:hypothetical protein
MPIDLLKKYKGSSIFYAEKIITSSKKSGKNYSRMYFPTLNQ